MDEVKNAILAILDANGGRADWDAVKDALPYEQRQLMPAAIKELKRAGIAQAQNSMLSGTLEFSVFRIGGGE